MSSRRAPLANVPNATNSPYRGLVKRSRLNIVQQDGQHGQPPLKKQMLEKEDVDPQTPPRRLPPQSAEGRVFTRKNTNAQPTAFERKLVAARDRQLQLKASKNEKGVNENQNHETIKQWQRHYWKVFPQFVFYFESIPEDIRRECSRQVAGLGAREEKFFSRAVTHVVTTRSIPPENGASKSTDRIRTSSTAPDGESQPRTINPSLLEKTSETNPSQVQAGTTEVRSSFKAAKESTGNTDVLARARQMGIKIWALEKLQRMISTMLDADSSSQHGHNTRSNNAAVGVMNKGETDLSQVLRDEKLNGPSDRDPSVVSKELVHFKGPFIYIHDMDEKTRPVMVREYAKVAHRQDGAWPQFRTAPQGKCPFVEEPYSKKDLERERERGKAAQKEKEKQAAPRTRSVAANEAVKMDPPVREAPRRALKDIDNLTQLPTTGESMAAPKKCDPPQILPMKPGSPKKYSSTAQSFIRPMYFAREPAASGMQASNITSAIRSQMISSTAAAPGAKAGTSKEVHELKRKVLEKNNGSLSMGSIPSSHRMTDIAGALKAARAPPTRGAKSKAQEKLGQIHEEDTTQSEDENSQKQMAPAKAGGKKKISKRDPKPGYCENCRDKFDDFEEHTLSRKHRKFAVTMSNWADLDALLKKLEQPLRHF